MLTEEQLREIEAAQANAEPGPWFVCDRTRIESQGHDSYGDPHMVIYAEGGHTKHDADFIAGARTWVPQLLAMVRELQRQRDYFRKQIRDHAIEEFSMKPEDIDRVLDEGAREASHG